MSRPFKGFAGEDFLAAIFTVVFLMVFIIAVINIYQNYLRELDIEEQSAVAANIARKVFFENNGVIRNAGSEMIVANNVKVVVRDLENGLEYTSGGFQNATNVLSSSLAILVYNSTENSYRAGRLEVYVGK